VISALSKAVFQLRQYVDQISNALQVKSRVLGVRPHHVNYKADLDEIKDRIENEPYLTVTLSDEKGTPFPLGVIHASDLFKPSLGTVSLRDFSNREETKIPSYLDVISILDHHKSQLSTTAASIAWISDAQSSNSLVAKMSFTISDRYTTAGMGESDIAAQIEELKKDLSSSSNKRILQKLLQKQLAVGQKKNFFVSPEREIMEYLHCLYAILDDTDLLSKVSSFDVECVAEILNRLKTLSLKKEVEIIHFDDLPRDANFAKKGAMRILQNDDMYSLYQKIYKAKEEAMEEHLHLAAREQESALFADTKEQNGCCRVGQTKLFSRNFATFQKQAFSLQKAWLQKAMEIYTARSEIDFHLHMISTIAGAEELHAGQKTHYSHQDELWLWTPSTEMGLDHLKSFLSRFRNCPQVQNNTLSVEFLGENAEEMKAVFDESFLAIPKASVKKGLSMAVLKYQAATLNSRKAVISPYLPTIL
jgi:hypothetical protein